MYNFKCYINMLLKIKKIRNVGKVIEQLSTQPNI